MPQVPYNPVPEATPTTASTPVTQLNKKQAFGENIGQGLERVADGMARMAQGADALARGQEKLAAGMGEDAAGYDKIAAGMRGMATGQAAFGRALDGAGTEIFGRAVAMQNLVNDADARNATTAYMMRVADLHANFNSLQGRAAFDALPKYKEDLVNIRKEIRDQLKNPMAQKLYDSESQGTMSRTMFSGAAHAATGVKQHGIASLESSITYKKSAPYADPNDPVEFATRREDILDETYRLGVLKTGDTNPNSSIHKAAALVATSEQRANQITAVAYKQPNLAANMLSEFRLEMTEDDRKKVEAVVRTQSRSVGASNIGELVWKEGQGGVNQDGSKREKKTLDQMLEEAGEKAKQLNPDDPLLVSAAKAAVQANWNRGRAGQTAERIDNNQTVVNRVFSGVKDEREFNLDPNAQKAVTRLHELGVPINVPKMINNANSEKNKETNWENYQHLANMAAGQREKFIDEDLSKYQLTPAHQKFFFDKQLELRANPTEDPRIVGARQTLYASKYKGELTQYGVMGQNFNQNSHNRFMGALQLAYYQWQENNEGKRPTQKQILDEIAPMVLDRTPETGWFGRDTSQPFYKQADAKSVERFKKWEDTVRAQIRDVKGAQPTDHNIRMIWLGHEFKRLYGKKKEPTE